MAHLAPIKPEGAALIPTYLQVMEGNSSNVGLWILLSSIHWLREAFRAYPRYEAFVDCCGETIGKKKEFLPEVVY